MNKVLREQLSAFLDDELETIELDLVARRVAADPELRATAFSYSLIGDVLRDELGCTNPVAFNRRVAARARDVEPARPSAWSGWGRSLAGAGVAAVVAIAAVLMLRNGNAPDGEVPVMTVPVAELRAVTPSYRVPAAYSRRAGTPDQLSRYYLNHSEYASMLGGQAPLVRIVSGPMPQAGPEEDSESSARPLPTGGATEP
jgi:negative regulator of sigma E activity